MEREDMEIAGRDNMISSRNPSGRDLCELDSQSNEAWEFTETEGPIIPN